MHAKVPIGGATFTIDGGDIRQIFAARELLARSAKGLNLLEESGKREFLARYSKERQGHPELGRLIIACVEIQLPDAPAAVSALSFSSGGSVQPAQLQARQEMEAILAAPEFRSHDPFGAEWVLSRWAGKNLNSSNATVVAEVVARSLSELISRLEKTGEAVEGAQFRLPIERPAPAAVPIQKPQKHPKKYSHQRPRNAMNDPQGVTLGQGFVSLTHGRLVSYCVLRADEDVIGAYRIDNRSVVLVSLKVVEIGENTAAARAGTYADGTVHVVTVSPEADESAGAELADEALSLGFFKGPDWPALSKRQRRNTAVAGYTSGHLSPGWITSPSGLRMASVWYLPGGGYKVTDRDGQLSGVFGDGFTVSQSDRLKGFSDAAGNLFSLLVTAYTYQGSDGGYYSAAFAENGQIVMGGVWLDGANRIASNFTDQTQFRTLYTTK